MGLLAPAAGVLAFAAHTTFPASAVVTALLAATRVEHVEGWRKRLVAEITKWANEPEQRDVIAELPSGFESMLLDALTTRGLARLDSNDAEARAALVDALTHSVFVPLVNSPTGWADARTAAVALVDVLPELLIRSAPDDTPLAPLRYLIGKDIAELRDDVYRMSSEFGPLLSELALGLGGILTGEAVAFADLRQVLEDRLPPAAADWVTVRAYLAAVIERLDLDPWTWAASGRPLSLSAVHRKLSVHVNQRNVEFATPTTKRDTTVASVDADELVAHCQRVVVLGGPGSGKSWLARRSAIRAAERALEMLTGPTELDRAEIPLFARCSQFFPLAGRLPPWMALVEAALITEVGDYLGSERVRQSLRARFAERRGRYLVLLDGLDEAVTTDPTGNVLTALTTAPARIVLTSRPAAWQRDLPLDRDDDRHKIAELLPLSYPVDVVAIIHSWLDGPNGASVALVNRLQERPDLARAATVPLVCAMYCLVAGRGPLPETRTALYGQVVEELLEGAWRQHPPPAGLKKAKELLQKLAWDAALHDSRTWLGAWQDDIADTIPDGIDDRARAAIDHVAPVVQRHPSRRRFVHRTIREYLVAEHLATLSVGEAAEHLEPHLWFDADWEEVICAAIALNPHRDNLLKRVVGTSGEAPRDALVARSGLLELHLHLCRLAGETKEADWDPASIALIHEARGSLGSLASITITAGLLERGRGWRASDSLLIATLLLHLSDANSLESRSATRVVAVLASGSDERRHVRSALLERLRVADVPTAGYLTQAIAGLSSDSDERRHVRSALLQLLAGATLLEAREIAQAVARLDPDPNERVMVLNALLQSLHPPNIFVGRGDIANAVADLAHDSETRVQVRTALLQLLPGAKPAAAFEIIRRVVDLAYGADERADIRTALLLEFPGADASAAGYIARAVAGLDPNREERAQVRTTLLRLIPDTDRSAAGEILVALAGLARDDDERAQVRSALLQLLSGADRSVAGEIVVALAGLACDEDERAQVRTTLLQLLSGADKSVAGRIVAAVAGLACDEDERAQVRTTLLQLLLGAETPVARDINLAVARLHPNREQRAQVSGTLIELLPDADSSAAEDIARAVAGLDPNHEERAQVRTNLLNRLVGAKSWEALTIARTVAWFTRDGDERAQVRSALLQVLPGADTSIVRDLAHVVAGLATGVDELSQVRTSLLQLLPLVEPSVAPALAEVVARLALDAAGRAQVRSVLRQLLPGAMPWAVREIARVLARLALDPEDRTEVRITLLHLLPSADPESMREIGQIVAGLNPDLDTLRLAISVSMEIATLRSIAFATRRSLSQVEWDQFLPELAGVTARWLV